MEIVLRVIGEMVRDPTMEFMSILMGMFTMESGETI